MPQKGCRIVGVLYVFTLALLLASLVRWGINDQEERLLFYRCSTGCNLGQAGRQVPEVTAREGFVL